MVIQPLQSLMMVNVVRFIMTGLRLQVDDIQWFIAIFFNDEIHLAGYHLSSFLFSFPLYGILGLCAARLVDPLD